VSSSIVRGNEAAIRPLDPLSIRGDDAGLLKWGSDPLRSWHERNRARQAQCNLDDHLLRDIGLRREGARRQFEMLLCLF
jgi:uncharacterized protein YjiS (DUF1127 family)